MKNLTKIAIAGAVLCVATLFVTGVPVAGNGRKAALLHHLLAYPFLSHFAITALDVVDLHSNLARFSFDSAILGAAVGITKLVSKFRPQSA